MAKKQINASIQTLIGVSFKIKIDVTDEDIKKGQSFESEECPVALAIKRATGLPVRVNTNGDVREDSWVNSKEIQKGATLKFPSGAVFRFPFSNAIAKKIDNYDEGKGMKPFSFYLES
jgi:hypothetical protein